MQRHDELLFIQNRLIERLESLRSHQGSIENSHKTTTLSNKQIQVIS